ncbi:MAG: FAD/NAD(P)-binding protein [Vitreimonas sp.]
MRRRRIAIVGAGFSGAAVAAQLMKRRGRQACDVILIERGPRFGPGLAYGGLERTHLLNVRASNMSAFPDAPEDFEQWLKRRERGEVKTTFATRTRYGAYVEDVLDRAARFSWDRLRRVRAEVVACRQIDGEWAVECADGKTIQADAVVLALGNGASLTPGIFKSGDAPVLDAWDPSAVKRVPRGADVLIVGAGLTMIDVALALSRDPRMGVIYALSRRGLAPRGHLSSPAPAPPANIPLPNGLSDALYAFRREVRATVDRGEPWQYAVDRLRARTPDLWRRLSLEQQRRFLRHLRPWWDVHRHRAAPQIAEQIAKLQGAGKLRVLAGEVVGAHTGPNGIEIQHRQRGSLARHRLTVARVINCTGASLEVARSQDPLIRQLLADGLARAHANELGLDVDAAGRVLDGSGAPQPTLLTLGPLTQGAFWECTAVPEIRVRAAQLADMLSNSD